MDKGKLLHRIRFFKQAQIPLRKGNEGPDVQKSLVCRMLRTFKTLKLFYGCWNPLLAVSSDEKHLKTCHMAKFKTNFSFKFLDASTEYNNQAEASRRPVLVSVLPPKAYLAQWCSLLHWGKGVHGQTYKQAKTPIWWASLFSCLKIISLYFLDYLFQTASPPNHPNYPPTISGHYFLLLWQWHVPNRPAGPGAGLCHSAFLKHKSHAHQLKVCLPSPSDASLKGCSFLKEHHLWARQRISKQLLRPGLTIWATPGRHTPVKDVCLLFFPSKILLSPVFLLVLGFPVSATWAKWWLLSSLPRGQFKCCSRLWASPTMQLW